ncbi:MAG: ABC transporter substrate-binding protein [Lachnospiraceae bacterium]|nr:ABC transporter substrate-binding protein [Lachnospiraceae bacterium]
MKKKTLIALLMTSAMALGMCTPAFAEESDVQLDSAVPVEAETQAEKVVIAVDDDSFTISPWGGESSVRDWTENTIWAHLCYRPFIGAMLENDELQMVAAKSVTKVDDLTYEVEIFDNIVDSEGNAITASDVVYSYDKLYELGSVSEISLYYGSSEATGDYTLTITLASDTEGAIEAVLCDCAIADEDWYENASDDDINSNPATTGAYIVTEMTAGSGVTLEAKDDYWKTEDKSDVEFQNVKVIEIRCITEASSRTIALENSEVDMAEVSSDEVSRFEGNEDYNITKYLNGMTQYLIFNCSENSVCSDVNVRLGIAYAFDAYNMSLSAGEVVLSHDVAPNLATDYIDSWDEESYFEEDLELAKEYLAAAGYDESNPLEVSILTSSQAPQTPYVALQAMLAEANITLTIDAQDRAARQTVQMDSTAWDIAEYSNSITDFTTTFWNDLFGGDTNQCFVEDETLNELLAAAMADRSEENMNAFHEYIMEQAYIVGVYTEVRSIVTTAGLTDICLQSLNPVPNAMTFTEDYTSVG